MLRNRLITNCKHIILSRTDNIGDVILTLPVAAALKKQFPDCKISMLARDYVADVVKQCPHIDEFIDWEGYVNEKPEALGKHFKSLQADTMIHVFPNKKIARAAYLARIPQRIGSFRRWHHFVYCNHLINFSRKKSNLHEAQLNLQLLKPFSLATTTELSELANQIQLQVKSTDHFDQIIDREKFSLIIHPGTNGNTREWPVQNFQELINSLPSAEFQIFITGMEHERARFQQDLLAKTPSAIDMIGKFKLAEFINFIANCDGLLAGSTGPLHIAAALGQPSLGLYPPAAGMSPERWAPIGKQACAITGKDSCAACPQVNDCECMRLISVEKVKSILCGWQQNKGPLCQD